MKYYQSELHEAKLRVDVENDQAFVKRDGKEEELQPGTKLETDAIIEGNEITEEEYNA
jgi:hypothetical protein